MTPEQRFSLLLALIVAGFSLLGFVGKRFIDRQDKRWSILDKLQVTITTDKAVDDATRPEWERRMGKTEGAIAQLLEIVSQQGVQIAEMWGMMGAGTTRISSLERKVE